MALLKTPKDNKFHFDPGLLKHRIQVLQSITTDDGYGGTTMAEIMVLETRAGKDQPSQYTQNSLNAGRSAYNQFQYFIIRNRKGFMPVKDMQINHDGNRYVIEQVTMLDDPCTFLKLLCVVSV